MFENLDIWKYRYLAISFGDVDLWAARYLGISIFVRQGGFLVKVCGETFATLGSLVPLSMSLAILLSNSGKSAPL